MNDKTETPPRPKKGKGVLIKLVIGLVLIAAGGGGTFALVQSGMIGSAAGKAEAKKETNEPKLIR